MDPSQGPCPRPPHRRPVPLRSRVADHVDSYASRAPSEMTSFLVSRQSARRGLRNLYLTNKRTCRIRRERRALVSHWRSPPVSPRERSSPRAVKRSPSRRTATALPATFTTRSSSASFAGRAFSTPGNGAPSPVAPEAVGRIDGRRELDETIRQLRTAISTSKSRLHGRLRPSVIDLIEELSRSWPGPKVTFGGPVDSAISAAVAEHLLATLREALPTSPTCTGQLHSR